MRWSVVASVAILLGTPLPALAAAQPDSESPLALHEPTKLREAAENLAKAPWVAIIEAEMTLEGEEAPTRMDEMTVWYESPGLVRLRLGRLLIEVTPGQLIAFHEWNRDAYYIAIDPSKTVDEMIARELPPLWCPWLSIALADGNIGVSPVVGSPNQIPVEWSVGGVLGSGRSATYAFSAPALHDRRYQASVVGFTAWSTTRSEEITEYRGIAAPFLSTFQVRPERGKQGPVLRFRREVMRETIEEWEPRPRGFELTPEDRERMRKPRPPTYSASDEAIWPAPSTDGRRLVMDLAALAPPPPELGSGDRFPAVSMSYRLEGRDLLRLWRPDDVFVGGQLSGNGPHPIALVLPVFRKSAVDPAWLTRIADAIGAARVTVAAETPANSRAPLIAGSPVIATAAADGDLGVVRQVADAWASRYTAHDAGKKFPSKMPGASWLPASLLLDRVAPGADAAIVVVDRSGWITGVIGPELTGDDLVEAITEAVRSAAR